MPPELSQNENNENDKLKTRDWGQEFVMYVEDNPGEVWISTDSDKTNLLEWR